MAYIQKPWSGWQKSPLKHAIAVRMTDPHQYHYHEDGKVKWRYGKKTPKTTIDQHRRDWADKERKKMTLEEINKAKQLL